MPRSDTRARELGMIHVAKKQLKLDDDAYRAMLWSVARVHSSADLAATGREAVLAHLKARGFRVAAGSKRRPKPPADRAALVAKIRALLIDAGRPDIYATASPATCSRSSASSGASLTNCAASSRRSPMTKSGGVRSESICNNRARNVRVGRNCQGRDSAGSKDRA